MILDVSTLTTPLSKETLFIYLAASGEAVNAVLLVVRKGKQYPVYYVSKTLHDTYQNYAPLEKVALALRHVADTLGKLAQYFVELGAYNITYEPCGAVKGQLLADFINEVPVGSDTMVPQRTPCTVDHQKDCKEEWILYTDGASSIKGSGAGLVPISLTKT
ncbi:reverse transcriptase domain-containing protein [Tanacetum coccineum]